nr:hypothetical protein [Methanospirillum lacunae]
MDPRINPIIRIILAIKREIGKKILIIVIKELKKMRPNNPDIQMILLGIGHFKVKSFAM